MQEGLFLGSSYFAFSPNCSDSKRTSTSNRSCESIFLFFFLIGNLPFFFSFFSYLPLGSLDQAYSIRLVLFHSQQDCSTTPASPKVRSLVLLAHSITMLDYFGHIWDLWVDRKASE